MICFPEIKPRKIRKATDKRDNIVGNIQGKYFFCLKKSLGALIKSVISKNIIVTIYSVSGQIVVNETNDNVIDISHLEDGVYFMNVKVGELTYIRKVIKQ